MVHVVGDRFIARLSAMAVVFVACCASGAAALHAAEPERKWTFRYRIVLSDGPVDPVAPLAAAQQFGTPPFLQVPAVDTCVPGLASLEIDFHGGPVLACKTAEDRRRLVLRLWNVRNEACSGSLKLPPGFKLAERCDALERPQQTLPMSDGRVHFDAGSRAMITIALRRE